MTGELDQVSDLDEEEIGIADILYTDFTELTPKGLANPTYFDLKGTSSIRIRIRSKLKMSGSIKC